MIKNKIEFLLLLAIILFTFTGCNKYNGTDDYLYVVALGIDKAEDSDDLVISIQTPSISSSSSSSSSEGSSQSTSTNIYTVQSKTLDEAFTILNNYLNKKINLSHCSALIISEELAKEGIKTYLSTLNNNTELRHSCQLIISSTSSYNVLDKISNSGEGFSSRLFDYLKKYDKSTGITISSTFGDFSVQLHDKTIEPIAIYAISVNDTIQNSGLAIFKDERMITNISSIDTIIQCICTNKFDRSTITIDNPFNTESKIDLEIELYKDTVASVNIINGSPFISLKVYPKGTILSSGKEFNYVDEENIKKVEEETNKYLERIISNYLYSISKDYNTDVVGFKGLCKMKYLTEDDFKKVHWDEIFQDSFFDVSVNTEITSSNLYNKE